VFPIDAHQWVVQFTISEDDCDESLLFSIENAVNSIETESFSIRLHGVSWGSEFVPDLCNVVDEFVSSPLTRVLDIDRE